TDGRDGKSSSWYDVDKTNPGLRGGGPAMTALRPNIKRIDKLEAIMDRLCAPDLTLGESKVVRGQLFALLGCVADAHASAPERAPNGVADDGHRAPCLREIFGFSDGASLAASSGRE